MIHKQLWSSLLALFVLVALPASIGASPTPAQSKLEEFRTKFKERMDLGDAPGMAKLMRTYPNESVQQIAYLCVKAPVGLNAEQRREIAALNDAWKATNSSNGFVDKLFATFSRMGERSYKNWSEAKLLYDDLDRHFRQNIEAKDVKAWDEIGLQSEEAARALEETGDRFHAGHAWSMAAIAYDETYRGSKDFLQRAADDYTRALDCYEAMEYTTDPSYAQNKQRLEVITKQLGAEKGEEKGGEKAGEKGGAPPAAGGGKGGGDEVDAGAIEVALTFQAIPSLETFVRPHFQVDDLYILWFPLMFAGNGSETTFDRVERAPKFKRVTSSQFEMDTDLDGTFDKPVAITGNKQLVQVPIGAADARREWAFLFTLALQKDNYQGLQLNMEPTDGQLILYAIGAGSMVGKLGDQSIRVIDEDLNGVYGNWPLSYNHLGISGKVQQPEMDSLVVGDSKRARPWSEYVLVGPQWYKLESLNSGTSLRATPEKLETGTVKLDFKGPIAPAWLVLQGTNTFQNTYIDLAADGKKGVAVPAGDWVLYYGELRKGSKLETTKCLILPGPDSKPWTVEAGKETVIKLGAPFTFGFDFEVQPDKIKVIGQSVCVVGSSGEVYERTWNCVPHPEAAWRKAGTKKASKSEKLPYVLDQQGVDKHGWGAMWHPLDLEMATKDPVEKAEVQIIDKKNKFFGPIESPWKG